ncbi:tyrosine-type recombinase/integrase [Methylobacterium sp. J-092]|uniref:tyrosine-type recombinase/integrase n=1 Tax=Methylobacterium sp. J-092 TaxID=2836667 RepID=UPI001FBA39EE|nr:site-specific integrase [Methylobacterium sp. J-092]MCJ2008394.1 site-specific integrase [Methylobacterium sp. J-092]
MATSTFNISLTKRERHRKLRSGEMVTQVRWVLNYKDPKSGQRVQLFFERQKEAIAKRNVIQAAVESRTYVPAREMITVAEAVALWLEGRRGEVKGQTLHGYTQGARYISDPILIGATPPQRRAFTETGAMPQGATLKPTLGTIRIDRLGTADIRAWHKLLSREVGAASASRARKYLGSALALAAEDMGIRPPMMPTRLKGAPKVRKAILTSEQIVTLLAAAEADLGRGIYVAFPFLAGTRPSEQFGLMWDEVDFEANVIRICRMQEIDGTLCEITKTEAGRRSIPMPSRLRAMLLAWKAMCPGREGGPHRVFPNLGVRQAWPKPRVGGGGTLLYANFRSRIWAPMLKRAGLPYVTPHSARHSYISMLQAEGVEVGLVAKIVGHASPAVTLGHYTQAVRGGEVASAAIDRAYAA